MASPTRYVPAVEVGLVLEHLDRTKKYVTEIRNGIWQYFTDWDEVEYSETKGWVKTHVFGEEAFDTEEELQKAGLDKDRKDVVTHWFLIGEESQGATFTIKEYGATKPFMTVTFDATGLVIDKTSASS